METGRGLLLVDGLDEVPAAEREEARRWLSTLLDRYPQTRCLATVRPNAVDKDWLRTDRFVELTLLPMSDEDIRAFVRTWHKAARVECEQFYDTRRGGEEKELLASLEGDLLQQLEQNTALRDLARTPLLGVLRAALRAPRLTGLVLGIDSLDDLAALTPNPRIEYLRITGLRDYTHMGLLRRTFPRLRKLAAGLVGDGSRALDLRDLGEKPDLDLDFWGDVPARIIGAEAFGDRPWASGALSPD